MKQIITKTLAWIYYAPFTLLIVFALSCCESSKTPEGGTQTQGGGTGAVTPDEGSGRPANMLEALARGKKENKLVVIELFDNDCNFCQMMQGSLVDKRVLEELKSVVHCRVTVEDKGVIEEFGLMESPTFLFFKPDGEFIEPFLQGFRSPHVFAAEINNFKLRLQGKAELPVPEDPHPDYGKG
jgi:thiol:disulfide interchange protein